MLSSSESNRSPTQPTAASSRTTSKAPRAVPQIGALQISERATHVAGHTATAALPAAPKVAGHEEAGWMYLLRPTNSRSQMV